MQTMNERRLELEGCFNFRDLGGYPARGGATVRWRTLFRSDSVHHLTARDISQLSDIGVSSLIDLRTGHERDQHGFGLLDGWGLPIHHLPLINPQPVAPSEAPPPRRQLDRSPAGLSQLYLMILDTAQPQLATALDVIASPDGRPAIFYCAAGKDRTGVLAALVLAALGVPDDVIVEDYALTAQYIDPVITRLRESDVYAPTMEQPELAEYRPVGETMRIVIAAIGAKHDSLLSYVQALPVGAGTLAALEDALLD